MHVTWDIGTDWIFAVPDFKITILKPVTFSLTEDAKLGFGTNKWRKILHMKKIELLENEVYIDRK